MKQCIRRGAALVLALAVTVTAACASNAMGWDVHTSRVPLAQSAQMGKNIFWSDTYSDLRTEYYVEYTPNADVTPTVAYGSKVTDRVTLSDMAQTLESQGKRVVSGLNGDWYVLNTGAPTGLVVTDGVVRSTSYYNDSWAIGFLEDGTAFIGQPALSMSVSFGGQAVKLSGGINKVRKIPASDTSGGLTLLTSDCASTTQNTEPGVDVILTPVDDGFYSPQPRIGRQTQYVVEQVLESTGSIAIPEGKAVLTMNGKDNATVLASLRALKPGDTVTLTVATTDDRWSNAVQALGGVCKLVTNGQVVSGLDTKKTAWPAVGIKADGTVVFYAMDGLQSGYSVGATQTQIAQRLVELGCVEALCMDGGGSTTIGVTYPGQSGMQVVNKPSDGTQRKNSTAIFLTTTLQPTGELGSYAISPTDAMVLSGATLQMTASGLDTNYYSTYANPVTWSATGGTVNENGLFTAGSQSGFYQVTATDGAVSGTAYITTVSTPESIRLTNAATGSTVTALNLDPGEQVDLTATAIYRKMALVSQDSCFTWAADPAVGTVDQNGVFTAGEKSGSGTLTVSVGGTTTTIPVSIAGHVKTLESCEGTLESFTATDTASFAGETGLDYVHNGSQSLKVSYDASLAGTASLNTGLTIPTGEHYLGLWVYGDGSGNTLMATVTGADQQSQQVLLTALDFTGWKHVCVELPDGAAALTSLDVIYGGTGGPAGSIWLDHFTTSNEEMHDTTAPTLSLQVSGTQLTAVMQDDVDKTLAQGNLSLTYDGAELPFTWNESTGTLTATLPAADSGYHRVSVYAADASGNLARASADVQPATPRTSPFSDMTGNWADAYATYLYDTGVSNGTGGDTPAFQPSRQITRAEFFAMVARWMGLDLTQYADVALPFADADSIPDWAINEVKAMYSLGILKGANENGVLKVNAQSTITRAEAITILGRTQPKGYAEPELSFDDASLVADWSAPYIKSLVGQGVVTGNDNRIRPNDLLTRGEVAKLLYAMR